MLNLTNIDVSDVLASNRGPRVLWRDSRTISSHTDDESSHVIEHKGQKLVVEKVTVTSTIEYVLLREFDPDHSYKDSIKEFTGGS